MKNFYGIFCLFVLILAGQSMAQTTVFTYQGKLNDGAIAANGSYDLQFRLFNTPANGTQAGATVVSEDVQVVNGIFTVNLDFGPSVFPAADERWLDIGVRPGASTGVFTVLSPRQFISSAPYAMRAGNAGFADLAGQANFASDTAAVGGTPAAQIIKESDVRLTDARAPLPNSPSYVQVNPAIQQPGANMNIGGNATVGGSISGGVVNAATQFNIGGNRVLSNAGNQNLFAGISAGQSNTTGSLNAFFGQAAGITNQGGSENSFFGYTTGRNNLSGGANSFFGRGAGFSNTTGGANSFVGRDAGFLNTLGSFNTFFGEFAGYTNTTGFNNTAIGTRADVATDNLEYATAIGAGSVVSSSNTVVLGRGFDTVQVPGNLSVAGTITGNINGAGLTNLNASNITSGTLADGRLSTNVATLSGAQTFTGAKTFSGGIAGNGSSLTNLSAGNLTGIVGIANGGTGSGTQNFVDLTNAQTIGGNKTFTNTLSGNIVNAATQYNIGGTRILSNPGSANMFVGVGTGNFNTGFSNTFVGGGAGNVNTSGNNNSFFGSSAGANNTTGSGNLFFGSDSGLSNNTGSSNSFFGYASGRFNTSGGSNSFFGIFSGEGTTGSFANSFFGAESGRLTNANNNSFFGFRSGGNTSTGAANTFVGFQSGGFNTTGSNNTVIGANAHVGSNIVLNINNSTAIGANAMVLQNNSIVLGGISGVNGGVDTNVGIGTTAPAAKLHVNNGGVRVTGGDIFIANPNTLVITSPNGACWGITVNNSGALSTFATACP